MRLRTIRPCCAAELAQQCRRSAGVFRLELPCDTYGAEKDSGGLACHPGQGKHWLRRNEDVAIAVGSSGDTMELAHRIAELGPRQVIIKLGKAGAVALIDGNDYQRDAIKVPVDDTVGAGDAFVASYIAELLSGLDPHQRPDTAVRTGAFACMILGGWEGLPRREELGMIEQSEPVARVYSQRSESSDGWLACSASRRVGESVEGHWRKIELRLLPFEELLFLRNEMVSL